MRITRHTDNDYPVRVDKTHEQDTQIQVFVEPHTEPQGEQIEEKKPSRWQLWRAARAAKRAEKQARRQAERAEKERLKEEERKKKELEMEIERRVREQVNLRIKRARFADFFAFCALTLSALLFALGPVLKWVFEATGGANILITLNTIAQYCMLAAVALPGFYFVRHKRSGWIVFYFVVIVIYIVGIVMGLM